MLMLVPSATTVSVVLSNGGGTGPALCDGLNRPRKGGTQEVRSSGVLDKWDALVNVCKGADTVYLLSALDIPPSPDKSDLQAFRTGVSTVLKCCQECGVKSLVFTSSARVVSSEQGLAHITEDENLPYVTSQEDAASHAVAMAEEEVLKASGMQAITGGTSCLYTCALRPATIYGTGEDRVLHRALSCLGWGLNRLAVGPAGNVGDMVYVDNLVEAQLLAGAKLAEGASPTATSGATEQNPTGPPSSGQAYFITDGQPCNLQAFLDSILHGLGFSTASKVLRMPTRVALFTALVAEVACKVGISASPLWTRADVRTLTENRTFSIARARKDLEYEPIVHPAEATKSTVESLRRTGWAKHDLLLPSLGYWICNPLGIWLVTLAAFGGPCPAFLAPLASSAEHVGLSLLHQLSTVRAVCLTVYAIHVLEGMYAFRAARSAGHRDTAPLWFFQTFFLGFPSIQLVNRLKRDGA